MKKLLLLSLTLFLVKTSFSAPIIRIEGCASARVDGSTLVVTCSPRPIPCITIDAVRIDGVPAWELEIDFRCNGGGIARKILFAAPVIDYSGKEVEIIC